MIRSLTPEQNELYRRTDEVLHYLWDPIGIRHIPGARDEYESYVPQVSLLNRAAASEEIVALLVKIETETMGLSESDSVRQKARQVVAILESYRDYIEDRTRLTNRSS